LIRNRKRAGTRVVTLAFFTVAFALSIAAPGNALRQERTAKACRSFPPWLRPCWIRSIWRGGGCRRSFCRAFVDPARAVHPLKASGMPSGIRCCCCDALRDVCGFASPGVYTGFGYTTERYLNVCISIPDHGDR
jgi:hypothetical protein